MNTFWGKALIVGLILLLGGAPSWGAAPPNNDGSDDVGNTAGGTGALENNTTGFGNTADGFHALQNNTTGASNTAIGDDALQSNTTGFSNTASGASALQNNTTGVGNVASGVVALQNNTSGNNNTANGFAALSLNTTGISNTAVGFEALGVNSTGSSNTAIGLQALFFNTTGANNVASGRGALLNNTTGTDNTASGVQALSANTSGGANTAVGLNALQNNNTGNFNTAFGAGAGELLTTGSGNIYLGGVSGAATESNMMRLGDNQIQATFIAGIVGVPVSGSAVLISSTGQLGIQGSSIRYKRDIQPMSASSRGLMRLRPVVFHYKQDAQRERQYGLIAEEVAKVYPELVTRGAQGEVESVRYHELVPMLLNEMQHQQRQLSVQAQQLAELKAQNAVLMTELEQQQKRDATVAGRLDWLEVAAARSPTFANR